MGFRLYTVFIANAKSISDEELLVKIGQSNLKKGEKVDFYDTSKNWEKVFIGEKKGSKIISSGDLVEGIFQDKISFTEFPAHEILAIAWNETVDYYGFCLIQNGKSVRKSIAGDGEILHDFGEPVEEEMQLIREPIFEPDEVEEIVEMEGEKALQLRIKAEIVCRSTSRIVKKFIGTDLMRINQPIDMYEFL